MDTRGIEVTNQLRSAIRAKLMELGVRYDEELPDYILVMVVNKKSRQQMHDDLNLFLEDCTTAFVDWLHDQVLKKLQKVTVAKKKSSREFVPTVVVKQEGEKKKRKTSATSFLEDQVPEQTTAEKCPEKTPKNDKQQSKSSMPNQNLEPSNNKSTERNIKIVHQESAPSKKPQQSSTRDDSTTKQITDATESSTAKIITDPHQRVEEASSKSLKRSLETSSGRHEVSAERRDNEAKRSKPCEDEKKEDATTSSPDTTSRKLKSCVNKPKITSVVSVKNRLGVVSPRKKFEIYREKEGNGRYRLLEKRFEKPYRYDSGRGRNRNFEADERSARRNRDVDSSRHHEVGKPNDIRSRIGESNKSERLSKSIQECRSERIQSSGSKTDAPAKKLACTIKDRLGVVNNKVQKQSVKPQEIGDYRSNLKCPVSEQVGNSSKNIKDRLGPLRSRANQKKRQSSRNEDNEVSLNLGVEMEGKGEEDELDNDDQSSGPVKSHIVAVNRSTSHVAARIEKKRSKVLNDVSFGAIQHSGYSGHAKSQLDKTDRGVSSDVDEEIEDTRLSSKVIVTPRPLKPLQPTQRRATQSLLLRAVAEANQSVVMQKNPEPSLLDKKPVLKRLKPAPARDVSQNLSVHFNSSKRLVMEKIQVELNTIDNLDVEDAQHEPYIPQSIRDEHMGVVMSLFQRSDDNQKFLVTLNGYNNNLMKEKLGSEEDEERLEMEVNEDDELALLTTQGETTYATAAAVAAMGTTTTTVAMQNDLENGAFETMPMEGTEDDTDASPKETSGEENNENCNTENVDKTDETPRKRRKLSPIIYNRSHSPSPTRLKSNALILPTVTTKLADKRSAESTVSIHLDKSRENCRYWPNCTLGNKCAYLHPPMCSAFPACKFGDKCVYRHPKCKFGLSCTKPGCVFSHPTQQCKYHPFCTKPACPYSHPAATSIPATEATSQRAKFTWRRRD